MAKQSKIQGLSKTKLQLLLMSHLMSRVFTQKSPTNSEQTIIVELPPFYQDISELSMFISDNIPNGFLDEESLQILKQHITHKVKNKLNERTQEVYQSLFHLIDQESVRQDTLRKQIKFKKTSTYVFPDEIVESGMNAIGENIGWQFHWLTKKALGCLLMATLCHQVTLDFPNSHLLGCTIMMQWMSFVGERFSRDNSLLKSGYTIHGGKLLLYTLFLIPVIGNIDPDSGFTSFTMMLTCAALGMFAQSKILSKAHELSGNNYYVWEGFSEKPKTNEFVELIISCFSFFCAASTPIYLWNYYQQSHETLLNPDDPVILSPSESKLLDKLTEPQHSLSSLPNTRLCKKVLGLNPYHEHTLQEVMQAYKRRVLFWHPDKKSCIGKQDACSKQFRAITTAKKYLAAQI